MGVLDGVRVLDVTRLLPGGFCSMILSDMGAEVIKVEQPGLGDYMRFTPPTLGGLSPVHTMVNRNKMSIGLNLKTGEGRRILRGLLKDSDVFLEGFRPGAIERLGFSFEAARRVNPRIVYCSISAFGHGNPLSSMPGHDINFQAMSGVLGSESDASLPYVQLGDLCAGMYAAIGILGALARKNRSAVYVDVPIVQSLISWLIIPVSSYLATGVAPKAGHSLIFGSESYYNLYRTSDGKYVAVAAIEEEFWQNLLRELGLLELQSLRFGTMAERALITRRLAETLSRKTRDEWADLLMGKDTCVTPVLDVEDIMSAVWVRKAGVLLEKRGSKMLGSPLSFTPRARPPIRRAPDLGEQTDVILRRLGYTTRRIAELRAKGAIE